MTSAVGSTIYAAQVRLSTEISSHCEAGGTAIPFLNPTSVIPSVAAGDRSNRGWFLHLWELCCLNNPGAHRVPDELHPVMDPELRRDVGSVAHHRPLAQV